MLGDGNLQTESDGVSWRYRALHKKLHLAYLMHKYEILKPFCGPDTLPKEGHTYDLRTEKTYFRWYFNTLTNPVFNAYGKMFYTYNVKKARWIKDVPLQLAP